MDLLHGDRRKICQRERRVYGSLLALFVIGFGTASFNAKGVKMPHDAIVVYSEYQESPVAKKQHLDLIHRSPSDKFWIKPVVMTQSDQRSFLIDAKTSCGASVVTRFDEFARLGYNHLAVELWKFCALHSSKNDAVYLDLSNPLTVPLQHLLSMSKESSVAILDDTYMPQTIHSSLIIYKGKRSHVAAKMVELLTKTPVDVLGKSEVLLPRTLYALIETESGSTHEPGRAKDSWYFLKQQCNMESHARDDEASWSDDNSVRPSHHCPELASYCCSVLDPSADTVVQKTKNPIHPLPTFFTVTRLPYNPSGMYTQAQVPYMSTVSEVVFQRPPSTDARHGLFEDLLTNSCLPSEACNECLNREEAYSCEHCNEQCSCYCRTFCQFQLSPRFLVKRLVVHPPPHSHETNRMIPRIIHQPVPSTFDPENFPDTSRAAKSYESTGWEYRAYTEDHIKAFFTTHFPREVWEAYNTLVLPELKLDVFRYSVLLIHGGLFANFDTVLDSTLDSVIEPDVGFFAAIDDETAGCFWPGFIASAPGHPFLAGALEDAVNQVRNRYTLVDVEAEYCPHTIFNTFRSDKGKLVTGGCLLSKVANKVLGRPLQEPFVPGALEEGNLKPDSRVPGRMVVLLGNREDMGAHRLTHITKNTIIAEADLQVAEEIYLEKEESFGGPYEYLSLYADMERANEDIQVVVERQRL